MIFLAFLTRLLWRRAFLAGWLNQVFTHLCQSLWKCPLGIKLFRFGAMAHLLQDGHSWLS